MIWFHLQLFARSFRWIFPAIIWLLLVMSLMVGEIDVSRLSSLFTLYLPIAVWITVSIGEVDDDAGRDLLIAATGSPVRLHIDRAAASLALISSASVVNVALASVRDPDKTTTELGAAVAVLVGAGAMGVGIGTLLHRPVLRSRGVAAVLGLLTVIGVLRFPPLQAAVAEVGRGGYTGAWSVLAGSVIWLSAASGAATWLVGRRP